MIQKPELTQLLGNQSPSQFMEGYWQKKPLLIRNAWPMAKPPITSAALIDLASEVDDSARIIQEKHPDSPWKASYGPFSHKDIHTLPDSHWTLLITDCEKHIPELSALIEPFRFIPDWRIDDLMISYAVDGGNVGPHVDEYDVFLLQIEGKREWQIGNLKDDQTFIPELDLKILESFTPSEQWTLDAGDMLYLPPNIPHYGIARGKCMTASVGFRAPSSRQIMQAWLEHIIETIPEQQRLADPNRNLQTNPGEITAQTIELFQQQIKHINNTAHTSFQSWLGTFLTESPRYDLFDYASDEMSSEQFLTSLKRPNTYIERNPDVRFAYIQDENRLILAVNGESYNLPLQLTEDVSSLCNQTSSIPTQKLKHLNDKTWTDLLLQFYQQSFIDISN